MRYVIIVPWHKEEVKQGFMEAWNLLTIPQWLLLEQDIEKIGCAQMKNELIKKAYEMGAEVIGVLDSDCYPVGDMNLQDWIEGHIIALENQEVEMFEVITKPQSRGTPYYNRTIKMPVAASIGFWEGVPDWDAVSQIVRGDEKMTFSRKTIYGKHFAFSGMNFAFHRQWIDCAQLFNIERFDDIFMGFIWQKKAYELKYCFNLNGPLVYHSRQSNAWNNLKIESEYLEQNEVIWQDIYNLPDSCSCKEAINYLTLLLKSS